VASLYADVRATAAIDPEGALERFRAGRHELFEHHPDRPGGLLPAYWPHRPDLRFEVEVDTDVAPATHGDFERFGTVRLPGGLGDLDVYWLTTYGGGVFLPFRDATNGTTTYGGGRYLLDTVKGADLGPGAEGDSLVIDFNFAYNPSCAYDPSWSCPLAQQGNTLREEVPVGERMPR
jgi:uncharacterized protein (DUF1684 family)